LEYEREGHCAVGRRCQRCGEWKAQDIVHEWTAWGRTSSDYEQRVCKRCSRKQRLETRPCTSCNGQGTMQCEQCNGKGYYFYTWTIRDNEAEVGY
jgi:hypothetical protein